MENIKKNLIWIGLFAIAMGFLEATVVIYLRELYYKPGFNFPLKPIPPFIARTEFFRELSTLIMLLACGIIAGKTRLQRFAWFVLTFAIWDIFYYIFLYICLGWPQSLMTWDILFLIPVPWVGPVWAPCLLSLLMIIGSLFVIYQTNNNKSFRFPGVYRLIIISGALVCILSFLWDYLNFMEIRRAWSPYSSEDLFSEITTYVPASFNYQIFFGGFLMMAAPVLILIYKSMKK